MRNLLPRQALPTIYKKKSLDFIWTTITIYDQAYNACLMHALRLL